MRFRASILISGCLLLLSGCSSNDQRQASRVEPTDQQPATSTDSKPGESPVEKPSGKPATSKPTPSDSSGSRIPTTAGVSWRASTASARTVAKQVDDMLAGLSGVSAQVDYRMSLELGDAAGNLTQLIKSPTEFSVQYPEVEGNIPSTVYVRADGKSLSESRVNKVIVRPVSTKVGTPNNLVASWHEIAAREVMAPIVEKRPAFSQLVSALMDPKSGYSLKVEERQGTNRGITVRQYRLHAVRTPAAAKKLGTGEIGIVVDANIHLPVSISVVEKRPQGLKELRFDWAARWLNNQQFDPKNFVVAKPTPEKPKA